MKKLIKLGYFFSIVLLLPAQSNATSKKEALFRIRGPGISKSFTRADLLKSKALTTLVVAKDPAYGGAKKTYQVIPISEVLIGLDLKSVSTLSFKCIDGFSGTISLARVMSKDPNDSQAYLAIELEKKKWAALKPGETETAGPFYLVWDNPEKSKIMTEEWPYQLSGFELSDQSLDVLYPHAKPGKEIAASDPIEKGHQSFMTNCFVCHAFNGDGSGKIGPDLNVPLSPSEYFQFKHFSLYVRNPQDLRSWDKDRMPGFSKASLSDDDIKNIWAYMNHMATKKNHK